MQVRSRRTISYIEIKEKNCSRLSKTPTTLYLDFVTRVPIVIVNKVLDINRDSCTGILTSIIKENAGIIFQQILLEG